MTRIGEGKMSFVLDRLSRNALVGGGIVVVAVLDDLAYRLRPGITGLVDAWFDTPDVSSKCIVWTRVVTAWMFLWLQLRQPEE